MASKLAVIINGKEYVSKEALKASNSIKDMGKTVDTQSKLMATAFSAAKIALVGIGVAAGAVLAIAGKAIKEAADMETITTSFEVLIGDVGKAKAVLVDLRNFAAATPLQFADITKSAQTLMAFGSAADDVKNQISMLGDIAMGNAEKLESITRAYGKIQAKGKASMEELNMVTEAGVPILGTLSKMYGKTTDEILKMVTAGKVGFADVDAAFVTMTSSGGQFYGMLEKQGKTFNGMVSSLKDNLSLLLTKLGEAILPTATKLLGDAMTALNDFIESDAFDKFTLDLMIFAAQTYIVFKNIGLWVKALYADLKYEIENLFKIDLVTSTWTDKQGKQWSRLASGGVVPGASEERVSETSKVSFDQKAEFAKIREELTKAFMEAKEATSATIATAKNTPTQLTVPNPTTVAAVVKMAADKKGAAVGISSSPSMFGSGPIVDIMTGMENAADAFGGIVKVLKEPTILQEMGGQAKEIYADSNLSQVISNPLDALGGFANSLMSTVGSLSSIKSLLDPMSTILEGVMEVLEPVIDSILSPLVGILKIFGNVIGSVLAPVLQWLTPIIEFLGETFVWLYNKILMPVGNGLIYLFNVVYNGIAGVVNGIITAINFLLGWMGVDIGKVAYKDLASGQMSAIDYGSLTESGSTYTGSGTSSSTSVDSVNITIYQTFEGNVIGDGGMESVGAFVVRAIQAYSGVGGNVSIVGAV